MRDGAFTQKDAHRQEVDCRTLLGDSRSREERRTGLRRQEPLGEFGRLDPAMFAGLACRANFARREAGEVVAEDRPAGACDLDRDERLDPLRAASEAIDESLVTLPEHDFEPQRDFFLQFTRESREERLPLFHAPPGQFPEAEVAIVAIVALVAELQEEPAPIARDHQRLDEGNREGRTGARHGCQKFAKPGMVW